MSDERTCHVATFGCRVNQADSEGITSVLKSRDLAFVDSHADADVVVINSCTVTHRSDADIRKLVHRVQRDNPKAKVVVAGCYAQRDPGALIQLGGTAAIVGNSHKDQLGSVIDRLLQEDLHELSHEPIVLRSEMSAMLTEDLPPVDPVTVINDRTRPFVKIQDGCDAACTYCVIPDVRGAARSAPADRVVAAVQKLVDQGYFEVVIAGVHLGTYAAEGETLDGLVTRVLDEVSGLGRLRVSCIEPMAFPIELADLARDRHLAPHFHLPLQSGCDAVLKRMGRPYRAADYAAIIDAIRERVPHACIGTDVIVGFPGETDAQFEETVEFVKSVGLDHLHVFSYSDRPGVPSTKLDSKVDPRFVKRRARRLCDVSEALWRAFLDRQVGRTLDALTLQVDKRDPSLIEALSDGYCPIRLSTLSGAGSDAIQLAPNTPVRVRITERRGDLLWGEAVPGHRTPAVDAATHRRA